MKYLTTERKRYSRQRSNSVDFRHDERRYIDVTVRYDAAIFTWLKYRQVANIVSTGHKLIGDVAVLPRSSVEALQRVQNAAARLVLNLGLHDHVTPALKQLHWLPVEHRSKYKLCALMHQIHTGRAPQYLAHSVRSVAESSRRPGLRSANTADYINRRTAALELNLSNVASVTLVQLPGIPYLTALSLSLTLIDL